MKTYFAYIRVSTTKQGERNTSLDEQQAAITAYAARQGLNVVRWYEEMETAAKQGRRAFGEMLGALRKARADGIIIHKIDRGARNLKDWAAINDLIDAGIEVHFAHESLDLDTRGGRLAADIQAVVAADFIRNLRDEVKKGIYGRLRQGLYPFCAPTGYANNGEGMPKTVDPATGPPMRRAFELYATGEYTIDRVRLSLAREGLRGRTGRPISKPHMANLLRNPFYIGIIKLGTTGETFEGVHEPLISTALFERVQAVLDGRVPAREQKHSYAFRRLIRCSACDRHLVGERQKRFVYYRCHSPGCRGTSVRETTTDAVVSDTLALLAFTPEELRDLRDLLGAYEGPLKATADRDRTEARRLLGTCETRLERLTDALLDGTIEKDAYEGRKAALLTEKRRLLERAAASDEAPLADSILKKLELGSTAYLRHTSALDGEKRAALLEVSSNLVVRRKNIAVRLQFPFDQVAEWRLSQKCGS